MPTRSLQAPVVRQIVSPPSSSIARAPNFFAGRRRYQMQIRLAVARWSAMIVEPHALLFFGSSWLSIAHSSSCSIGGATMVIVGRVVRYERRARAADLRVQRFVGGGDDDARHTKRPPTARRSPRIGSHNKTLNVAIARRPPIADCATRRASSFTRS